MAAIKIISDTSGHDLPNKSASEGYAVNSAPVVGISILEELVRRSAFTVMSDSEC